MSTDPRATQAKADGSAAWSLGNYDSAIEHFTTAISFGGDKEFLKLLYSNRSAAYLKIKKNNDALKDANKCVELDSNWGKGYARKGDALISLRNYTEAYNAYNYGLRVSPGDATLTEKCEQAMKYMRHDSEQSERQSTNAFGGGSSPAASVPVTGWVYYAKMTTLALCVLYLLPLGRFINTTSYKLAAGLFATTSLFALYKTYGFPKFTSEYGMKIIPDPSTMRVFMGLFLIMAKPYILPIAGLFLNELTSVTPVVLQYVKANLPAVQSKIQPLISQYMPSMAGQDLSAVFNSVSPSQFNSQLLKLSANCEVLQGVFLVVELILPTRNVIQLYLWWQYLQMRYMLDQTGNIKFAFTSLDRQITGLSNHRLCPQIVRTGYGYIKAYMAKQVTPPTGDGSASGGAGGAGGLMGGLKAAMSKCTIM